MARKRPTALKTTTRAASGGAVLVGAVLVLLFFRGAGIGIGVDAEGEGEADQAADTSDNSDQLNTNPSPDLASVSNSAKSPKQNQTDGVSQPNDNPNQQNLTIDEQVATGQKTLGILIDERSYLLRIPGTPQDVFRPNTLDRLVQLAQLVSGDTNGIRVTILRRETARTTAEQELKAALANAGIGANAIYMPNDFVP